MKVLLTEEQQQKCRAAALERVKANERRHQTGEIVDMKISNQPDLELELESLQAEVAVAKAFRGRVPGLRRPLAKSLPDVILVDGQTIEVKFTDHSDGHLLIPPHQVDRVMSWTWIILVTPTELVGGYQFWHKIRPRTFIQNAKLWHVDGKAAAMSQAQLEEHGEALA